MVHILWVLWILFKVAAAAVLALILYVVFNPLHRFKYRHVPGPAYRPIFGNLVEFMEVGSHEFMLQCRQRYGPIFKLWIGHVPWVVVCDPEVGKRVNYKLINRPTRVGDPLIRGPIMKAENKGLFFSRDDHWRRLHRVWQPAFYADSVRACAPLMETTTQRMIDRLQQRAASGQSLDIWREVGNLTMSIVGTAAYGIDFHTLDNDAEEQDGQPPRRLLSAMVSSSMRTRLAGSFALTSSNVSSVLLDEQDIGYQLIESGKVLFRSASAASGSTYQMAALLAPSILRSTISFIAHAWPDASFRQVLEARMTLSCASMALVKQARRAMEQQQQQVAEATANGAAAEADKAGAATADKAGGGGASGGLWKRPRGSIAPGSFLSLLLSGRDEEGRGLTDLQLLMQANIFTLAGYETTANTLAFSLFCLASDPDAEAKAVAEIRAAAAREADRQAAAAAEGTSSQPWYCRDLEEQFPFICAVVNEALRLYPPGASTFRETPDVPMQIGPYVLPPHSTVLVGTYVMQRDPEIWPQAHQFLPERWLPGNEHLAAKNPAAYLPFGSGGRQCIGQRFALQEVRLGLVQLMQRFHFDIDWTLMAPANNTTHGNSSSSSSDQRCLKTVNYFTLSPAGGIWVKAQQREHPVGAPLL